jgi:hypothetical protein
MIKHLKIDVRILDPLRSWLKSEMTVQRQKAQLQFTQGMHIDATSEPNNKARYGCNRLAASFRAPFLAVAGDLIIAQVIEKPIKDHESAMSGTFPTSNNIGLNQNIISLNAHLEFIQDELMRWEVHPCPILRIAAFDKNFLQRFVFSDAHRCLGVVHVDVKVRIDCT